MINKVILVGRLGKDPEIRHVSQGSTQVANFSVATDESYKDKQGERQHKTEWHNITIWGKMALIAEKYLKKGTLVYIEGKIHTRSYEGKDGQKKYVTEIVAQTFTMLGSKKEQGTGYNDDQDTGYASPSGAVPDDDLPF